jgi:hypothetical protein
VMLSGCYSNGKFHSPTWSDMAFWKKDKAPDTSLAAAPSVTRPSDEALADKSSPGAKAGTAPPYEAAAATYTSANAGSGASRYPDTRYPETSYPDTGYAATSAPPASGGTNWATNGNTAAANVASNPYAKSGGGYDTGSRYDGRSADHAQTTPYDSAYPGNGSNYSARNTVNDAGSRAYSANPEPSNYGRSDYSSPASSAPAGNAAAPTGPRDNPYYTESAPAAGAGSTGRSQYDEGRYTSPDRYAPPAAAPTNDKYTQPGYASPQDSASRYNTEGYRGMTGDRYANDPSRTDVNAKAAPAAANPYDARTADSRNTDQPRTGNEYQPGSTGYQPSGVPSYEMPTADGRSTRTADPYQPGGTSRYESPTSRTANGGTAPSYNGVPSSHSTNPYAEQAPSDRYQEPANNGTRRY